MLAARIIAVADAYDALTGRRDGVPASEDQALEELRRRTGTQLDPAVVDALAESLARRPQPAPGRPTTDVPEAEADQGLSADQATTTLDHDHPSVSDTFAEWQPEQAAGTR